MSRKIVLVPALGSLFAMPENYDAAKVTREDTDNDAAICPARAELESLRRASLAASGNAIATAETEEAREAFEANRDAIADAWTEALGAAERADLAALRAALVVAASAAQEGGDNAEERKALAMLAAA